MEIANVPVRDTISPFGEFLCQQRAVFVRIQNDDVVGRLQISGAELLGGAKLVREQDAPGL